MEKKIRIIYFICALVIFICACFIIIAYSMGYSIDFSNKNLVKTGSMYLETEPRGADIFIDDKKINDKTSKLINRLIPKEYDIKIQKENFHEWNKKINIKSGEAVYFSNIILFRSDTNPTLIEKNIINPILLSDNRLIFKQNENQINKMVLLENDHLKTMYEDQGQFSIINPTNLNIDKIIIKKQINKSYSYFVVSLNGDNVKDLNKILLSSNINIKNYKDLNIKISQDNNILFLLLKNQIYKINLETNTIETIFTKIENTTDFFIFYDLIYYFVDQEGHRLLKTMKSDDKTKIPNLIAAVDNYNDYKTNIENKNYFILYSELAEKIMILNKNNGNIKIEYINKPIKNINWDKDKKFLLYQNDFEIWQYDLIENKKEIIVRQSENINQAVWHPEMQHIIYSQDNIIKAVEIQEKFYRQYTDLINSGAENIFTNQKGDTIYWLSPSEDKYNLYKKELF